MNIRIAISSENDYKRMIAEKTTGCGRYPKRYVRDKIILTTPNIFTSMFDYIVEIDSACCIHYILFEFVEILKNANWNIALNEKSCHHLFDKLSDLETISLVRAQRHLIMRLFLKGPTARGKNPRLRLHLADEERELAVFNQSFDFFNPLIFKNMCS